MRELCVPFGESVPSVQDQGQKQHEQEEGRAEVREVMRPLPGGVLC